MSKIEDFVIRNNIIVGYRGNESVVNIPDGIDGIAKNAFYKCDWLTDVVISGSVQYISDNAFDECTNLSKVTLNEGLKLIGRWAFSSCFKLEDITIPSSVKAICANAFFDTPVIEEEGDGSYVDKWLVDYHSDDDSEVIIRQDTVGIAENVFVDLQMEHIIFPDSLKYLCDVAINSCSSLMWVYVPHSTRVGTHCIENCAVDFVCTTNPDMIKICKEQLNVPVVSSLYQTDFFDTDED